MKHILFVGMILLLIFSCSENPVTPPYENDAWNLHQEAANFSWELVSGKIAYNRRDDGVILIDGDAREMKILKKLYYLDLLTWHHTGMKITGVDVGTFYPNHRSPKFYCIDLDGNYHLTKKSIGSTLWISPLMALYWFFDLQSVAKQNKFLETLRGTKTFMDAYGAFVLFAKKIKSRPIMKIPLI